MLNATLPEIAFRNIRQHNGSQNKGFEELCVQLLIREHDEGESDFYRVEGAGGDGGVEAYICSKGGKEIGIQAKWFNTLGNVQWRQIDKSVRTALSSHPKLVRYEIDVPLNRTVKQIKTWKNYIASWAKLRSKRSGKPKVHFVWRGESELMNDLATPENRELLHYWFGVPQFTDAWMDSIIAASISNLDRRYSPMKHVETEAGRMADTFAWSPSVTTALMKSYVAMMEAWTTFEKDFNKEKFSFPVDKEIEALRSRLQPVKAFHIPMFGLPDINASAAYAEACSTAWSNMHDLVTRKNIELKKRSVAPGPVKSGPHDYLLHHSEAFGKTLGQWRSLLWQTLIADRSLLLIMGEAGTGKSHLMASVVMAARQRGQPALLLLGEQFTANDDPWAQLLRIVAWSDGVESLISALNQAGRLANAPALVCIDALNESEYRNLWHAHLNSFAAKFSDFPFVRLIVSCRSDFVEITLPAEVTADPSKSWANVLHRGFGEEIFEAVGNYFEGYNVSSSHFPPLIEEFRNPLFLRVFCEAFENQRLPDGPLTLERVISARIDHLANKLRADIDCTPEDVRAAIDAVANAIGKKNGQPIPLDEARRLVNAHSPEKAYSKSLYTHLRSNGMLVEVRRRNFDISENETVVRFPFERFSDYFVASAVLHGITTKAQLKKEWRSSERLGTLAKGNYAENRGAFSALSILMPERYGVELADLNKTPNCRRMVLADFLASLPWRGANSFSVHSELILKESQQLGLDRFIPSLLRITTISGHPYNGYFLNQLLVQMTLPVRDQVWTIPVSKMTWDDTDSIPAMVNSWALRVPSKLVSDEQSELAAQALLWFLSSNNRAFRDRATQAAIHLLDGRSHVVAKLVKQFALVNDPYVVERLYAVASGVAMKERDQGKLNQLACSVYDNFFQPKHTPPHILARDYAQSVLEVASYRGCLPDSIPKSSFRPPLLSKWPAIWGHQKLQKLEKDEGWNRILFSIRPEQMMPYGDFGRYVMQSAVHNFSNKRLNQRQNAKKRGYFDEMIARNYVLQRVYELGWTPENFSKSEYLLPNRGRLADHEERGKIERISKKYQWIALHELLGFLSDHYHLRSKWRDDLEIKFLGAWQISVRNFDPSAPPIDLLPIKKADEEFNVISKEKKDSYPDPFSVKALSKGRNKWMTAHPDDFSPLIWSPTPPPNEKNDEWVALAGYHTWIESKLSRLRKGAADQLKMFMHLRSWLISEKYAPSFLKTLKGMHFWGTGVMLPILDEGWLGEYPWGSAFADIVERCALPDSWTEQIDSPRVQTACDSADGDGYLVPSPQMCEVLGVQWGGKDSAFIDHACTLMSCQVGSRDNRFALVRKSLLLARLREHGLRLIWGILGEKDSWDGNEHVIPKDVNFSAVYQYEGNRIKGGVGQFVVRNIPLR